METKKCIKCETNLPKTKKYFYEVKGNADCLSHICKICGPEPKQKIEKKKRYATTKKKDNQKLKRAKVCIDCEKNNEGFCNKYREWCFKVNYICLGIKNPYEYKMPKSNKKGSNK